jgi:hypothetical protein
LYFRNVIKEIFLELDETKAKPPIFPDMKTESKAETEEGQEAATPWGGAGPPWLHHHQVWALGHPLTSPFRLEILSVAKTLNSPTSIHKKFYNATTIEDQFRGIEVSIPAPCRDGELPPEAISIDSTAIFIAIAVSHDEDGVVLPQDRGLYR